MTPKHIQSAIVDTFTSQLAAHGLVLSPEVLADCAAQAATVIASHLDECPDCGYDHAKCRCSTCRNCDAPIDGYEPTAKDAKLAPCDRLCEDCHADDVKRAVRQKRREDWEARGDYLRDMQRGEVS